jgi:hypothetical protein
MLGAVLIRIQKVSKDLGQKERDYKSASPTRRVILEIEMCALRRELETLGATMRREEWRVC